MEKELYNAYIRILNEELVPAMGCTEPIAVAYAAAVAAKEMPQLPEKVRIVGINSGSGNQGITASVPVIVYAKELGVSEELLYRALAVSNLVTLHLKSGIGPLSAYCGAAAGIVSKGVENTIDNVSRLASEGMRKTDAEIIKIMLS